MIKNIGIIDSKTRREIIDMNNASLGTNLFDDLDI